MVEPYRPQLTMFYPIRRMRFAYCIVKTTDTHLVYALLFVFPLHEWSHEGL